MILPTAEQAVTLFATGTLALHVTAPTPPDVNWADDLRLAQVDVAVGGGAALTCIQLRRLGHRVEMLPLVGCDRLGAYLIQELVDSGVEVGRTVVDGRTTSRTVALTTRSGLHDITFQPGDPDPRAVLPFLDAVPEAAFVYAPGFPGFEPVLERLRQSGATIVTDLGYRPWFTDVDAYTEQILDRCAAADIVVFSAHGIDERRLLGVLRAVIREGPTLAVATLGAGGAQYISTEHLDETGVVPAIACQARNTHGAGDAFIAGLIAGLAEGSPARDAIRLAHATAAAAISLFPAPANRSEVDRLLRSAS